MLTLHQHLPYSLPPLPWSYNSHTSLSTSINWLACLCCATLSTGPPSSSSPSPGATPCENLFIGISKTVTENRQCAFPCTNQCTGVDPREKIPEKKNSTKLSWKPSSSCPKWCQVFRGVARIFQRGGVGDHRGYSPDCHVDDVDYIWFIPLLSLVKLVLRIS